MIIKNEIVKMAAICETLLVLFTSKKLGYKKRIAKLKDEHKISPESGKGLNWLWEIRAGIHLYELTEKEYNKYSVLDFRKAKDIGTRLVQELNKVSK